MSRYPPDKVARSLANIRTGGAGYKDAFPGAQGLLDLTDKNYNEIQSLNVRLRAVEKVLAEALVKAKLKK